MAADDSALDLERYVVLLVEWFREVALHHSLHELYELATEVVRRLLGHLSREVVHAVEQDLMVVGFAHVTDFFLELVHHRIVEKEGLFNGGESARELDGAALVCRDVGDAHQLISAVLYCLLKGILREHARIPWFPVDTLNQPRYQVKVLVELPNKVLWICIILPLVEGFALCLVFDEILRGEAAYDDLLVVRLDLWPCYVLAELRCFDLDVWKLLKDFDRPLGNSAGSSHAKNHGH